MPNKSDEKISSLTGKPTVTSAFTMQPMDFRAPNLTEAWKKWKTYFTIYMRASGLDGESDQRKSALLLHHMGPQSLDVFNSFDEDIDKVSYANLIAKFDSHFVPRHNISMERHKFFTRRQQPDESIEEFVTVLKNLSLACNFGTLRDDLVKDIFICGMHESFCYIKESLLSEGDIKVEKAIEKAKLLEMSRTQTKQLESEKIWLATLISLALLPQIQIAGAITITDPLTTKIIDTDQT